MNAAIDILKCVKCGSCKALCPTYSGEASEPMTARGRLTILSGLKEGILLPSAVLNEKIFSCALCGSCETLCPTGMEITEAIYEGRGALAPSDARRRRLRKAAGFALRRPALSFRVAAFIRPLLPYLFKKAGFPFSVSLPDEPLRERYRVIKGSKKKRVAVFTGCSVNFLFPHLGKSLIEVLSGLGYEVVLPPGEVCCGAPLRALGLEEEAVELAKKNIEVFGRLRAETVLSLCPTCTLTLKRHYPKMTGEGIENAMDASEFLSGKIKTGNGKNRNKRGSVSPVVYHDPCHLRYGLGVKNEPREIIKGLGYELKEKEHSCCGFSLSLTHDELSTGLLEGFDGNEGDTIVTACPGCMLQLRRKHKNVRHIIELIAGG